MTDRNWKPFIKRRAKFDPGEVSLSLRGDGELSISLGAFHALRSPLAIALFYDENRGLIGITPTEAGLPNAVPLRKRQRAQQRNANLAEFLTSFRISRPKTTIRFPNPTFDPDGILVLDYRTAVEASSASCRVAELQS